MEQRTIDIEETEAACIFRVHEGLHNANKEAYTPILISIGAYHHGQPKLLTMEKRKGHYLELLLQRNNNLRKEDYLDSMKKLEERARKYYADPVDHLRSDEFLEMMLHDACFVIEFLFGMDEVFCANKQQSHAGDEVKVSWKRRQICSDLMLLENRLPFFVISEFYDMNPDPTSTFTLKEMVFLPNFENPQGPIDLSDIKYENISVSEIKHFLDLVRTVHLPSSGDESNNHQNKNQTTCFKMPCVIELQDAGVKFEAVEDDDDELNLSIFDIRFENGHFKMPKFQVTDGTETFFRNIIAYEQHSSDNKPKYFTDYTSFMDELINSKEDVTQLRRHEVLENWLGDDEVVALMFNNLDKGTIISNQFYYSEQCSKVNAHCKRQWNRVVASLNRDYFTNIWVTVATICSCFSPPSHSHTDCHCPNYNYYFVSVPTLI